MNSLHTHNGRAVVYVGIDIRGPGYAMCCTVGTLLTNPYVATFLLLDRETNPMERPYFLSEHSTQAELTVVDLAPG